MATAQSEIYNEEKTLRIFYPSRPKLLYEITDDDEMFKLLNIAMTLKEKRKNSVEGLLYLENDDKRINPETILTGEADLVKKERGKYLKYVVSHHKKYLPTELLKDKLQRRIRKVQTLKVKTEKEEKKERDKELKEDDLMIHEKEENGEEDFADLEELDEDYNEFEDDEYERESRGGGGDGEY